MSDCRLTVALTSALTLAGCAAPEQALLEEFFAASRLRDRTALQRLSTVTFEPLQQGIVRTFRIGGVTPERADGDMVTKDVRVDAPVILPDGRAVQKTLVVTLQRATGGDSGRWIVTGVRDAPASRAAPPS